MAVIEKCLATDCIYNEEYGKCSADNLWIDDDGYCEGYEIEKKEEGSK